MNEKLLQQAMAMFDSQEKWDAFLELCDKKDEICNRWVNELKNRLKHMFTSTVNMDKWQFHDWVRICPKELGWDKIEMRINFGARRGYLYINYSLYDSVKARQIIQSNSILMSLLNGFEYWDGSDIWNKPFDKDICTYTCDSSCYLWGHDTERVAKVLFETYIQPFMTDEIADFFVKVCEESKKQ